MADGNILSNFGIDLLEEEIDDVIFQTNEFLTDATFTGAQGPFWWILQMCMALAALFAIIMTAGMAYKMMVKHEPLDIMKLFQTAGCVACAVLVVPSGRYGYGRQRQQLVLPGLPVLHPELHRVVHPRPLSGGSRANQRQVRGSAGTHLCQGHDVHQPTGAGGRGPYRNIRPEPDRGKRWNRPAWTK